MPIQVINPFAKNWLEKGKCECRLLEGSWSNFFQDIIGRQIAKNSFYRTLSA
jgi:hypothetical protein